MNQAYVMTADRPVPQYRPAEITLSGMTGRNNPYAEIEVEAEFVSPSGRPFRQPAFWDGGNIWKIRFAPDEPGKWSWKTVCTDPSDKGLHGVTGVLECVPNGGDLDLERHGMIRVGGGGRYFVHADGTPFLWLGDTHWMMFDTESLNDCNHPAHKGGKCPFGGLMQHIAAVRCRNGFTVFQTYPNAGKNWFMKDRTDMVDPEHFRQAFDPVMEHLASLGFVIALGVGHYTASVRIPEADLCRWGRYIAARYGAFPVVWITCQEMNSPAIQGGAEANRQAVWEKVAAEIARANGMGRPHSAHQWVTEPEERPVWHLPWHSWFALQGGHTGSGLAPQKRYQAYRACRPVRPVVETEAMYEYVDCGGVAYSEDARRAAWRAMLCGCCGYTYGAAGIWALKKSPDDKAWLDYNRGIRAWYDGLGLPGASQMRIMADFFRSIPWTELEPRFRDPAWSRRRDPENCVLASVGNDLYLAYCHGKTSAGELRGMDADAVYSAEWFDPRTGTVRPVSDSVRPSAKGRWSMPERPSETDWLLVVKRK